VEGHLLSLEQEKGYEKFMVSHQSRKKEVRYVKTLRLISKKRNNALSAHPDEKEGFFWPGKVSWAYGGKEAVGRDTARSPGGRNLLSPAVIFNV